MSKPSTAALPQGQARVPGPARRLGLIAGLTVASGVVACAPPAGVPASPDTLGPPIRPERGVVRIHLESTDPERGLELIGYGATRLEPVGDGTYRAHDPTRVLCKAPCDSLVDTRSEQPLLVGGLGTPDSAPFLLESMEGDVRITAEPGSSALLTTGTVLSAVGGLTALVGGGVFVVGLTTRTGEETSTSDGLMTGGGVAMGVGTVILGTGLVMRYFGATYVDITPQGVAW